MVAFVNRGYAGVGAGLGKVYFCENRCDIGATLGRRVAFYEDVLCANMMLCGVVCGGFS